MEHEDIVKRIRQSGDKVSLSCISLKGRDFYREVCVQLCQNRQFIQILNQDLSWNALSPPPQLGFSPLLFHDPRMLLNTISPSTKNQKETPMRSECVTHPSYCDEDRKEAGSDQSGTLTPQVWSKDSAHHLSQQQEYWVQSPTGATYYNIRWHILTSVHCIKMKPINPRNWALSSTRPPCCEPRLAVNHVSFLLIELND